MAILINPLSDIKVSSAKPKDKDYKLFDGGGLFCLLRRMVYKLADEV